MNNFSLLFVESPLQLMNAHEATFRFKLENFKYVIRLSRSNSSDRQLINVVKILKIDSSRVEYVSISTKNRNLLDYIKLFLYKYKFFFTKQFDRVFIGNIESGFFKQVMRLFSKEKIILLDDGSKTIVVHHKMSDEANYSLFTMYDLRPYKNQLIYKNEYKTLHKIMQTRFYDPRKIIFLGMKLSEYNIITQEYYLELITKISDRYFEKEILYISHRGESKKKLEQIAKNKNITIESLDYPVEMLGIYVEEMPYKLLSFYSSALLTMKRMYALEVESFSFDYQTSKHKDAIDTVYKYYQNHIKVIDLDA